jgi:hypothetical protein
MAPRKTPRLPVATFYLGDRVKRPARLARLDDLAKQFAVENRSQLIAKIADGELMIVRPESQSH